MAVMHSVFASAVRVLVAIAMGFGFAARMPAADCGASLAKRRCECCANPESSSCCAAPENRAPEPQPAAPTATQQWQPAALHQRAALVVLAPSIPVIFPTGKIAHVGIAAGHSFQSVRCVWTV